MTSFLGQDKSKQQADERLQRYLGGRYGQRTETKDRYAEAIQACGNILYLDKTVSEIAKIFGHTGECLRNQLKRHFPDLLAERERIRAALGLSRYPVHGVSSETAAKYAPAIELLRTTSLTIREVAERCGLGVNALQQHVLFYHQDLAQKRLLLRVNALDKKKMHGGISGTGRQNAPRKATEELYAEALNLYRTTDRKANDIALECGVDPHNFHCYIQRWHRGDMAVREKLRRERVEKKSREKSERMENSRVAVAIRKYTPAMEMIKAGATYEEAAKELNVDVENLCRWVRTNHPEIHQQEHRNQIVTLPEGTTCSRESWAMFREAAEAYCNTDEPLRQIAERLGLRPSSLRNFLVRKFPKAVASRRE